MNLPEEQTCSFVIKLWLEEREAQSGQMVWRGHITHVSSGERHYIKDLNCIITIIAPYLTTFGVQFRYWTRFRWWVLKKLFCS